MASATRGLQDLANNRYEASSGEVIQTQQGAF
jgi:hypothetical protein